MVARRTGMATKVFLFQELIHKCTAMSIVNAIIFRVIAALLQALRAHRRRGFIRTSAVYAALTLSSAGILGIVSLKLVTIATRAGSPGTFTSSFTVAKGVTACLRRKSA